jgi:hypothetical protein
MCHLLSAGRRQTFMPQPYIHYNRTVKSGDDENLEERQRHLELLRARVYAAKTAYLNRSPFEGIAEVSYDDLKAITQQFIRASYDYQKLKYGSVKVRLSVAKLLRR